jgi:hypothetical protein
MSDQIGTTEAREKGFYWVILGQNPPEIAYWERGEWWLAGNAQPSQPEAMRAAIAEHGPDGIAVIIQGKLLGDTISEAGIVAQPRVRPQAAADEATQRGPG